MLTKFIDIKSLPKEEMEVVSAYENLMKFCKPVQLYNILHARSQMNPIFLPRCLNYKIRAKREKNLQVENCEDEESDKPNPSGIIVINYMNSKGKILKAELVENFSCPFCLMPCGDRHGILRHLLSSHDIFDYKFWYPAIYYPEVDVFLKPDAFDFGEKGNDNVKMHKKIPFSFCSKRRKIRQKRDRKNKKQPNVDSMELDLGDSPRATENILSTVKDGNMKRPNVDSLELDLNELPRVTENELSNVNNGKISPEKTSEIQTTNEPGIGKSSIPKKVLLATRRRKLAAERSEAKRVTRLQSRPFYHSQKAQPMSIEEVLSDADSEGEPDDDDANLKERLWLNQLVNVSDEDKQFMHLWNTFVRKQRVIADGHVPWAFEEFTKLYEKELNGSLSFFWQWKHFMIHLWSHGLICGKTFDKCSTILENSKAAAAAPSTSRDPANGN